jgi:solute carrier family 25, member 34/35
MNNIVLVWFALNRYSYLAKNRLQAQSSYFQAAEQHQYRNTLDCLIKIFRQNGFVGLFHGVTAALPRVIVGSATQLTTYDKLKELAINTFSLPDGFSAHLFSSFISSLFTVTLMNPFDVISTRIYQSSGQQTVYYGVVDCFRKTIDAEGWRALQKGWLALYLRLGPHTILTFLFLEKIRAWLLTSDLYTKPSRLMSSDVMIDGDSY